MIDDGTETPVPGVISMDHTADLGLEIRASTLPEALSRAVAGMTYLLLERVPDDASETRVVRVEGPDDVAGLLRVWLREVLFLFDSEGFAVADVAVETLEVDGVSLLETTLRGSTASGRPVREIKGVTLHGLTLERRDDGWFGRVIFDV